MPPANPARPSDLFDADGIYRRAPATIEAIREILGNDTTFKAMMRRWLTEHAYGSATTEQFIALVKKTDPTRTARWTEFFRQWLYTSYPTAAPGPGQPPVKSRRSTPTTSTPTHCRASNDEDGECSRTRHSPWPRGGEGQQQHQRRLRALRVRSGARPRQTCPVQACPSQ